MARQSVADLPVHRMEFEIPWPPHTAYAYLLETDEPVLVDAGTPYDQGWQSLSAGLDEAGYAPADIEHLLVTHPHTDHDGQVSALVEDADPTVYALEGVRDRLSRDADDLADGVRATATEVGVPDPESSVEEAVDSLHRNREIFPPSAIDVELVHGEPFTAGDVTFEPIHVPGHQENQAAFRTDDVLFAGDTLIESFRPAALHVGLDRDVFESIDAFHTGLDHLAAIAPEIERVYPGHGPIFTDAAAAVDRDRASLETLVDEVRETLGQLGAASPYAVTEARVEDPRRMDFSLFETVGSLARLERHGTVDSWLDGDVRQYRLVDED